MLEVHDRHAANYRPPYGVIRAYRIVLGLVGQDGSGIYPAAPPSLRGGWRQLEPFPALTPAARLTHRIIRKRVRICWQQVCSRSAPRPPTGLAPYLSTACSIIPPSARPIEPPPPQVPSTPVPSPPLPLAKHISIPVLGRITPLSSSSSDRPTHLSTAKPTLMSRTHTGCLVIITTLPSWPSPYIHPSSPSPALRA